jgi:hypothetical protein
VGFGYARSSCVRVFPLWSGFRVRESFLRARFPPFEWVSGSRELLACSFSTFGAGFGFARTSCVRIFHLLSGFRVRENFLRARFLPFAPVSGTRDLLACSFSTFCAGFGYARSSCVLVFHLMRRFWVCENFLARFQPTKKHANDRQERSFVSLLYIKNKRGRLEMSLPL